jgi:hypothetical protein
MKKLLLLIIIVVAAWFFFFKDAEAQVVGFPFGGRIIGVTPCTNGLMVILGPPTPMRLMYSPLSRSFSYGPPRTPGQWLLGTARPGGVCNLGVFLSIPTAGTIIMQGSSLF